MAVDVSGNVYVADRDAILIKKWTAASNTVSTVIHFAFNAMYGGVAVDGAGNIYVADELNKRIVKVGTTQGQRKLFYRLNKEKKKLEAEGHDTSNRLRALELAQDYGKILYTGIFYRNPEPPPTYDSQIRKLQGRLKSEAAA